MTPYPERSSRLKRKLSNGRTSGFCRFCKQLCKQSLITGFPVIASTRNFLRKIVKVLVFLGCMCGFLYQTLEFLMIYRAYPTVLDVRTSKPSEVEMPALTFCNANRVRRINYCTDNPNDCYWFTNKTRFCHFYPKYCNPLWSENETCMAVPYVNALTVDAHTREYIQDYGENFKDFMFLCEVKAQNYRNCKNPVNVSWVNRGYPNNCFTVESLWGLPQAQVQKMPLKGIIVLSLNPQPEQYTSHDELIMVHLLLHEAHSLENPFMEGIRMEAGKVYNVFINQRVTERLPSPYQTNCTDYLKLWKENGGYGPLTGKACTEQCIMENMLKEEGCVARTVTYPGNYTICKSYSSKCDNSMHVNMTGASVKGLKDIYLTPWQTPIIIAIYPSDAMNKKCSLTCSDACREITYRIIRHEVTVGENLRIPRRCEDINCMYSYVYFLFLFHRMEVEKSVHQPKYESVELFSYIGGYMGMWLGISLVAVFDLAETLVSLSIYGIRKEKKKNAVHGY